MNPKHIFNSNVHYGAYLSAVICEKCKRCDKTIQELCKESIVLMYTDVLNMTCSINDEEYLVKDIIE